MRINENDDVKTNSTEAWILAARPKTLAGAAVPVIIGTALAFKDAGYTEFQILPAVLCFLFAFLMQIDSNLINDYFDCIHGNDDFATRLGPKRACAEGWITLPAMRTGLVIVTGLACLIGLPLIFYGGWGMVAVGAVCVLFAFLYTTFFSYHGLGDLLVIVFFGIIPVSFTYYVIMPWHMQHITAQVLTFSVACGFVIDTLLCINNFRDRDNDARDGKLTLIVRMGEKRGQYLYLTVGLIGLILTIAALFIGQHYPGKSAIAILPLIAYPVIHIQTFGMLRKIWQGRELNRVLGLTARNMFVYGMVTACAILMLTIR